MSGNKKKGKSCSVDGISAEHYVFADSCHNSLHGDPAFARPCLLRKHAISRLFTIFYVLE